MIHVVFALYCCFQSTFRFNYPCFKRISTLDLGSQFCTVMPEAEYKSRLLTKAASKTTIGAESRR